MLRKTNSSYLQETRRRGTRRGGGALALSLALSWVPAAPAKDKPQIAVIVVIDALRADDLQRHVGALPEGGLRRLQDQGVVYLNVRIDHAVTAAGPGNATLATGARPSDHGIVADAWFSGTIPEEVPCTRDPAQRLVVPGATLPFDPSGALGPALLEASTLSDELILATGARSKAWSVSGEPVGALFLAGHLGKAIWISSRTGTVASSTGSFPARAPFPARLPAWIEEFEERHSVKDLRGRKWSGGSKPPEGGAPAPGAAGMPSPQAPGGKVRAAEAAFVHEISADLSPERPRDMARLHEEAFLTPLGDALVVELCLELMRQEDMGSDGAPDLLHLGWTSFARIQAAYGARSQEAAEALAALDAEMKRLLDALDRGPAGGRYVVVLTADRGAPADARDLQGYPGGKIESRKLVAALDSFLDRAVRPLDWVLAATPAGLWLNPRAVLASSRSAAEIEEAAAEFLRGQEGILEVVPRSRLETGRLPATELALQVSRSYFPGRVPDLFVVRKPHFLLAEDKGTVSAGPHAHDTHVPLIFYAPGSPAARVSRRVGLVDVAPTLAILLETPFPSACRGEPLQEVVLP
jgi:arylsulfatase A-like enzyme